MIRVFKLNHKGKIHIGLRSEISDVWSKIKTIEGAKYTRTHGCYYIPYTKEAYRAFRSLHLDYTIESGTTGAFASKSESTAISEIPSEPPALPDSEQQTDAGIRKPTGFSDIRIHWTGRGFCIKMPYSKRDVQFVKSLAGSWWRANERVWYAKSTLDNLEKIQKHFSPFDKEKYSLLYEQIGQIEEPRILEIYRTPEHIQLAMVKVKGFGADVSMVKSIPDRVYNKEYKRWEIPLKKESIDRLIDYYGKMGYKIINRLPRQAKEYQKPKVKTREAVTKLLRKTAPKYHTSIIKLTDAMLRMSYSHGTIMSYGGKIARVLEYCGRERMEDVKAEQVNDYLTSLSKSGASDSLINMVYSAVNLYFDKVVFDSGFKIDKLKRPRRAKTLPGILSTNEVDRLLASCQNIKHLTILYALYGGGLRVSEVVNLRVQDIHWERNQILIKSGKGRKDRMVMLSDALKQLMSKYFDLYQPEYWLFEGQKGKTQYSTSSVQKIVKQAAKNAGINRRVTPHTLRHCFATHLMDKGLDSRYIQELLGHKDIKTTLIYTHVTNKSISTIESPLDMLMDDKIKKDKKNL